jgi:predicted nucleic acid-binding protein
MNVLLDTNVVSELWKATPDPTVVKNVRSFSLTYVSCVSLGELVYGVERLPHGQRRRDLETALLTFERSYAARILALDGVAARIWGELDAQCEAKGVRPSPEDGQIAAIALLHGLPLVTRNIKDFTPTGVQLINPWEA